MSYTAYETADGSALDQVEAYCAHLTEDSAFSTDTNPTKAQVEKWLTTSHALIAGWLLEFGYSSVQTDPVVLGILEEANAIDTVIKVELNNPTTINGEPNDRFKWFQSRRDELKEIIDGLGLASMGATLEGDRTSLQISASGISKSDKQTVRDDTDAVQHRFRRDFGRNRRAGSDYTHNDDLDQGIIDA